MFLFVYLKMFIYRVKQNGFYKDYSNEYQTKKEALDWYKKNGEFLTNLSNRKIILFKNSKKVM